MSSLTAIPQAILDAILNRLAHLFLSAAVGDKAAAREMARQMLSDYHPETAIELQLAAEVISLGLHLLDALDSAYAPDLSENKILRLRGCAISLSREQHKAQRKLDQLQRTRRAGSRPQAPEAKPEPSQPSPKIEKTIPVIQAERPPAPAKSPTQFPSLQSLHKQQAARLIAANLRKKQAEHASQTAQLNGPAVTQPAT